ncbi:MAG: thiamine-phosphate kinase [Henriciella sp.]
MNETDWIQTYIAPLVNAPGAADLRDDVALLSTAELTIATMDTLVEGVHFLPADPIDTVGQKLVRVNVSDILAKGAMPAEALLSIAWPKMRSEDEFEAFVLGLQRDLENFEVSLIGGDLVGTDGPLMLTLTMTGACIGEHPVRRSGGRPGQVLWVSGEIGWGGLGLQAAQSGGDDALADRYRVPWVSGLETADLVAKRATASMDVSDGLFLDASRLATASRCGVRLDLDAVPLAKPTSELDDIFAQCSAGDDYQILLAAAPDTDVPGFAKIGELTESAGLSLHLKGQPVNPPSILGFEH